MSRLREQALMLRLKRSILIFNYLRRLLAVCSSISSDAWIALEFVSYCRWIRSWFTISSHYLGRWTFPEVLAQGAKTVQSRSTHNGIHPLAAVGGEKVLADTLQPGIVHKTNQFKGNPFRQVCSGQQLEWLQFHPELMLIF